MGLMLSFPKYDSQSLKIYRSINIKIDNFYNNHQTITYARVSAKYCQGWYVCPWSADLSSTQTPGLGELPILTTT